MLVKFLVQYIIAYINCNCYIAWMSNNFRAFVILTIYGYLCARYIYTGIIFIFKGIPDELGQFQT